jgi:hypothetical protein
MSFYHILVLTWEEILVKLCLIGIHQHLCALMKQNQGELLLRLLVCVFLVLDGLCSDSHMPCIKFQNVSLLIIYFGMRSSPKSLLECNILAILSVD